MSRVVIAAVALFLGLAALPVIGAASEISDEPTCKDVNAGVAATDPGEECFPGSTARRAVVVALLASSAIAAVSALILGGVAVLRDTRGILFGLTGMLAAGLFFAAYGAVRF